MEELLHEFTTKRRIKGQRTDSGSNVITEYTSSAKYGLSSDPQTDELLIEEEDDLNEELLPEPYL
ncbi:hypothetical protein NFI96_021973, partial [Prochilodus magdalenae]